MGVLRDHFLRKGYPPLPAEGGGVAISFSLYFSLFSFYSKLSILSFGYIPSRHRIYGYLLRLENPFPNSFLSSESPFSSICLRVNPLLRSCAL